MNGDWLLLLEWGEEVPAEERFTLYGSQAHAGDRQIGTVEIESGQATIAVRDGRKIMLLPSGCPNQFLAWISEVIGGDMCSYPGTWVRA